MTKGSVTLGDVAARTTHINIACSRCERRGHYRLSKLVATLGEDFPVTSLAGQISDCPKQDAPTWEKCDVFYPGLRAIMDGGKPSDTPKPEHGDDDDD
ncbi:hypothetical protein PPMP20_26835 [Paraburkholderia phymatum]|nr:hypothetical protein [Paraburkholderia phymatum]